MSKSYFKLTVSSTVHMRRIKAHLTVQVIYEVTKQFIMQRHWR